MPLVRIVRERGANLVIEADGEVLFGPGGPVPNFTRSFSTRAREFAAMAAPDNKRPRWGHYGLPLKRTMRASTRTDPLRMRAYAVIGSTAPHSGYVDQGTGIYAGHSAYEAKILPPTAHGAPDLREATYRPPGAGPTRPIIVRGQRGQGFFDEGLRRAFAAARMPNAKIPGSGGKIDQAINSAPDSLLGFLGNTPADAAFRVSLDEWRAWRDAAFNENRPNRTGRNSLSGRKSKGKRFYARATAESQRALSAERSRRYRQRLKREGVKPKSRKPDPTKKPGKKGYESVADKKAAAVAQFQKQNPNIKIIGRNPLGLIVQTGAGPYVLTWSQLYGLL